MIKSVQLNFSETSGILRDVLLEMTEKKSYIEPPEVRGIRERIIGGRFGGKVEHTINVSSKKFENREF